MDYRDVVIHTNYAMFSEHPSVLEEFPPISERINLSHDISLERLDINIATSVMDTCEPKTFGLYLPVFRQFAPLYAFVRELPPDSPLHRWDEDNHLSAALAISRLVHPTSTGFVYAARIACESGKLVQARPAEITSMSRDAFVSPTRTRDWLTPADATVLAQLVPLLPLQLPRRVHSAFWHHEYAARTYYVDHRWTLVCTGLEALVHTDRFGSTKQFSSRTSRLASELGISFSESDAEDAYDLRSRLAHGLSFLTTPDREALSPANIRLYDQMEETLRRAVLRSMRDKMFAETFVGEDRIRQKWPI
jgi:hypothetical protein